MALIRATLSAAWHQWKRIARRLGEVQTWVVLTVLYFVLVSFVTPFTKRKDPLGVRRPAGWRPYRGRAADLATAREQ